MRNATIALSGKGGVGKTSIAALLIKKLSEVGSVLAIDADPDSNLPHALGVTVETTVGQARESVVKSPIRSKGMKSKDEAMKLMVSKTIQEFDDFDLVVMGRSEEGGCYCYINNIIRQVIDLRSNSYDFTVIDCHAGLEHLSRRTTKGVDILIVVAEPTKNGILTARRVIDLSQELAIDVENVFFIANKVTPEIKPILDKTAKENDLRVDVYVPFEKAIADFNIHGNPVVNIAPESPVKAAVDMIYEKIFNADSTTEFEATISKTQ